MGKNSNLETLALSGKKAKMRTSSCPNNNLLNCYLGIATVTKKIKEIDYTGIILRAIDKLKEAERLINLEIEKQTAASEVGFIDAELGYNLKKVKAIKTLLLSPVDINSSPIIATDFIEKIDKGVPEDIAALEIFQKANSQGYGVQTYNMVVKLTRKNNVVGGGLLGGGIVVDELVNKEKLQ